MRTTLSSALIAVSVGLAGCSGPPEVVDMTPRFMVGESRTESLQSYAALRSLVDVTAHVGFTWRAKVVSVGPEGATIDAQMNRVVAKLPGLITFDSDGLIPLGSLLGLTDMLFKLVGVHFQYVVGPTGEVAVTGWQSALGDAAKQANVELPTDGSVPTEDMVEEALRRIYGGPMPRRLVKLEEAWSAAQDYHVGTPEQGPRVSSTDGYTYAGWGELKVPFGGDEEVVNGLGVPITSKPEVTAAGTTFLGTIDAQTGRCGGYLVVGLTGDEVLGYWESNRLKIQPKEGLLEPGVLSGALSVVGNVAGKLADLECGWAFFAGSEWR